MSDTYTDPYAQSRETTEGTVYSVTGGDWDDIVNEIGSAKEERDRKSTRLNSSHSQQSRMPSSA